MVTALFRVSMVGLFGFVHRFILVGEREPRRSHGEAKFAVVGILDAASAANKQSAAQQR
jgi:hypothetical protein